MHIFANRRDFLLAATGGACSWSFLNHLPVVHSAEAKLDPKSVQFHPDIEPLVRLIEDTPKQRLLEIVANRIRQGLAYRNLLAALLLAGVRNVQPRPYVGFKFHAVLVVNSAHLASLAASDADRWLPIFWALDHFKNAQDSDVREGDWTMAPVNEATVPPPHRAKEVFIRAMDTWDLATADAAVVGLARNAGANEVFELFARFGPRDFRSIGHKAIFVANAWRTLQCIGWRHAGPVLRSLAYALLSHTGGPNPAGQDLDPDKPGKRNRELAKKIRPDWQQGRLTGQATSDLLAGLRTESDVAVCAQVVEMLNRGVSPRAIYDALFLASGELLMRQPAIVALHAVTTTNALHYIFQSSADDETRRWVLLQNAAFLPLFRQAMKDRGKISDERIDQLQKAQLPTEPAAAVAQMFATLHRDRLSAAQQMLACLEGGMDANSIMDAARRLIFLKGDDSHDYKFSSAVLEDFHQISPPWRNRYLAASMVKLRGSGEADNPLVKRTRAALES